MKDIVNSLTEQFRREHRNARRYVALLLVLAMMTTLFVNWQLHGSGIAATAQYQCGEVEHTHTADCYEKVLVCGYEEGEPEDGSAAVPSDDSTIDDAFGVDAEDEPSAEAEPEYIFVPHEHTEECYQEVQTLTCLEEEHVHTDDCFDPEDGSLICDKFEHTHDESCYTTEYELVCGLEEGELVEELNPDYNPVAMFEEPVAAKPVVVEPVVEAPVHHHTDDCYEEVLVCGLPEHHHTVNCLADPYADIEDESEWLAKTDTALTGMWPEDLVTVAKSQLGYEQSEKNFQLDTDDGQTVRHYTRYGQWYGNPYGEWNVMFLSYCLNYADVPQSVVPQRAGTLALRSELRGSNWLKDAADTVIQPGDIVFYNATSTEVVAADDQQPQVEDDSPDADIALLSMDAAESEPQTEERTVTTEMVGIVSDADEEGNLTVISGNVDGKVAEVPLTAGDVTGVIDLAAAYAAQAAGTGGSYIDGVEPADDVESAVMIWAVDPASLASRYETALLDGGTDAQSAKTLDSYIEKVVFQKEVNKNWTDIGSTETVKDGDTIRLVVDFNLPDGTFPSGSGTMTYQLPGGLKLDKAITDGVIKDAGNGDKQVGTYTISTDGKVTMNFTNLGGGSAFSGNLTFTAKADYASAPGGEIKFGNDMVLHVTPKTPDLSVKKGLANYGETGKYRWSDDEGNIYVGWQVTVSTNNGSGGTVHLKDELNVTKGFPAKHTEEYPIVLVKYNADGTTTTIDTTKYPYTLSENGAVLDFAALPELAAGEKYVLSYVTKANAEDLKAMYGTQKPNVMYNTASAETDKVSAVSSGEQKITYNRDVIKKSGSLNADGLIEWTIVVSAPQNVVGGLLKDYKLQDTLPKNIKLVGDINVKIEGSTTTNATITKDEMEAGVKLSELDENAKNAYRFTITYKTTAPTDGTSRVENRAYISDNLWSTGRVDIKSNDWNLTKSHDRTDSDIAYWNLNAVNATGADHFELTDTIGDTIDDSGKALSGKHYAIASELQSAIEAGLELHLTDGTTTLSYAQAQKYLDITYQDANGRAIQPTDGTTHVLRFTVAVKQAEDGSSIAVRRIVLNSVPTHEARGDTPTGAEWTFNNSAKITQDGSEKANASDKDTYHCYRTFEKMVAVDGKRADYITGDTTVNYDEVSGQTLLYRIVLVTSADETGDIEFEDTLPEGTTWGSDKYKNKLYVDGVVRNWRENWSVKPDKINKNLLRVTVGGCNDGKSHVVEYLYQVSFDKDSRWNEPAVSDIPYTNSAKWGEEKASITTTVHRDVAPLTKTGQQLKDAKGRWTNNITYTVIINPAAQMLNSGKDLKLRDMVEIKRGNSFYGKNIRLYYYKYGEDVSNLQEVEEGRYHIDDPEGDYWLCMTVPDKTALLLQYDIEFDPGSWTDLKLTNTVYLNGDAKGTSEDVNFKTNDSSVQITRGQLVIRKTDAGTSKWLPGAEFTIDYYDSKTGQFKLFKSGTTDENGELTFSITKASDTLSQDVLYRLTETKAPDSYILDKTPRYLFFYDKDADARQAFETALGSAQITDPDNGQTVTADNVTFGVSTKATTVNVKNTYNQLSVYKYWLSAVDGKPLAAEDIPAESIQVQLCRYLEGQTAADAVVVDTQELNAGNSWSYTWTGENQIPAKADGKKCYYLVKEVDTGNWITDISNNGGIQTGKIFISNRVYSGYELPSTGGMGTVPFAAAGGMLTAAAVLGGAVLTLKNRKKHE